MVIVFDMDNTLVDEMGSTVRPGIVAVLDGLSAEGHTLVLWTNSRRERALDILRVHDLRRRFKAVVCREDYDPRDSGVRKDIRRIKGELLVDDDPDEIAYVRSVGRRGFQILPYRKGRPADPRQLAELLAAVRSAGSGKIGLFG
jgi:FMN phosphatase YigB (HAD superfamily)